MGNAMTQKRLNEINKMLTNYTKRTGRVVLYCCMLILNRTVREISEATRISQKELVEWANRIEAETVLREREVLRRRL